MYQSLIIVDDFLLRPQEVRQAALKLTYPKQDGYFPGRNSLEPLPIPGLDQAVSRLTGEKLVGTVGTGHQKCRVALEGDEGRGNVHIDQTYWSGILFLTLPDDCQGGTDFFRHIPTNTDHAPYSRDELEAMGFNHWNQVWDDLLNRDTNDPEKWEHIMRIPMRFNRLVLLKPLWWHNAGPSFGDSIENGRLVYLMFFNLADDA